MADWYNTENERHRRYDEFGVIQVFDAGHKRYLCFGSTDEQSCQLRNAPGLLQHEYARAMVAVLCLMPAVAEPDASPRITLLGLGGGTLASGLAQVLPKSQVTAVELRRAVVQVARQYFSLPKTPGFHVEVGDAGVFLQHAPAAQADVLISDLYLSDGVDKQQLTQGFIVLCWEHLADGGWLVINLWREHRDQQAWLTALKQTFGQVLHATTKDGNWIIWAQKRDTVVLLPSQQTQTIRQRAKALSARAGFNLWRHAHPFIKHR